MERKLSTIMAVDLVGYSRLMSANEDSVIARLKAIRSDLIDPQIAQNGGRIVKTMGDGLLIEFASAVSAVRMALTLQNQMHDLEKDEKEDDRFQFRVGINTGEVVVDAQDVLGDCVNIAARLESIAPPGGICIGKAVYGLILGKIDAPMTGLGPQPVKNIPEPIDVWRVEIKGVVPVPTTGTAQERASIAVLPFDNMSRDPDQDFLADGIVEDVITELSRFRGLFVIARNSTFAYKGAGRDIRKIAEELGVQYVVEGSVRRAGDRLRITAQLIEAETGTHIWAERWDRTMEDLFDLQDELTAAIVSAVEPELGAHERSRTLKKQVENLTVWELCHRAHNWQTRIDAENFDECESLIRRALDMDPDSIRANVLLTRLMVTRIYLGICRDPDAAMAEGLAAGRHAVALDDRHDAAQAALGMQLVAAGFLDEALANLERGIALNPNNGSFYYNRAFCWIWPPFDCPDKVAADMAMAEKLSPRDTLKVHYHGVTAMAWLASGQPHADEKALASLEQAAREPNPYWIYSLLAAATHAQRDDQDSARKFVGALMRQNPDATLSGAPDAIPMPVWVAAWNRVSDAGHLLVKMGLPSA